MARQRRGAWSPPELRGTLGTLLRTTLAQAGSLRDVLERGAREGRSRVEDALAGRRRTDALAELGEIVLELIRRGEIDTQELPEVRDVVAHLDELDAGHDRADDAPAVASPRKRFDARIPDADDGTVSRTWAPPRKAAAPARVWRPPVDADDDARVDPRDPAAVPLPKPAAGLLRKGGISFDDDDSDLADFMHPDDIPKKP